MSAIIRVRVPVKAYDHRDNHSSEWFEGGCWVGRMNDDTHVYLCGQSLKSIIEAYESGEIIIDDEGNVIVSDTPKNPGSDTGFR